MELPNLNNTQLCSVLENASVAIAISSVHNKFTWVNKKFCQILNTEANAVLNKTPADFTLEGWKLLLSNKPRLTLEIASGGTISLDHTRCAINAANEYYSTVHYYVNNSLETELTSKLSEIRDQLLDSQLKDPLTGLSTLRALIMSLEPQIARCRRYDTTLSIISMKPIYKQSPEKIDFHADHSRTISQQLKDVSRWADQIAIDTRGRYVLVLPETERSGAVHLAHKIYRRLKRYDWLNNSCFGITQWNKLDNSSSLLTRTNKALDQSTNKSELIVIL